MDPHNEKGSDLKTGLLGMVIGVVWLFLVMGFSSWLALN